jgi:hypothetical protein
LQANFCGAGSGVTWHRERGCPDGSLLTGSLLGEK